MTGTWRADEDIFVLVCPVDKEVLRFGDCIVTFLNPGKAFVLSTKMILHFFLSLLDSPLKELLFRLEAILDIGILGVNCILYPILLGFWEAVKILPVDVVSPGWAFTNLINFRIFHLPKGNQLPNLL